METRVPYILLCSGIGIISTATLLHIIGMSTPHWVYYNGYKFGRQHFGIFEICTEDDTNYGIFKCQDFKFDDITMKQGAAQVLVLMALITGVTSGGAAIVLLLIVYLSRQVSCRTVISGTAVSAVASIASSMFIFSAIGIFVDRLYVKQHEYDYLNLNYSFALCLTAAILYFAGFVISIIAGKYINTGPINPESEQESIALTTNKCLAEESVAIKEDNCG